MKNVIVGLTKWTVAVDGFVVETFEPAEIEKVFARAAEVFENEDATVEGEFDFDVIETMNDVDDFEVMTAAEFIKRFGNEIA